MPQATSPFRFLRLQFSLRAMLLLMLLVGAAIVIFRWPWEEVKGMASGTPIRTRYHRSWNGKPVKHGREVMGNLQRSGWERWYDEGDLRIERSWKHGSVDGENRYLNGVQHGLHWDQFESGEVYGEYRHGQKWGEWRHETAKIIHRQQWREDRLHGRTTWESKAGQLLQSATYEQGKLTHWNDQPFPQALETWFAEHAVAPHIRQMLLTRVDRRSTVHYERTDYREIAFQLDQQKLNVFLERLFWERDTDFADRLLGEVLLLESLDQLQTFAYQYNTLTIVPISEESLVWQNRTGVYDVKFTADSEQAEFWLQQSTNIPHWGLPLADRISRLLEVGKSGPIEIDVAHLIENEGNKKIEPYMMAKVTPSPRCDLLGKMLNAEHCYVEQRGNKLVFKRHADQPRRSQQNLQ